MTAPVAGNVIAEYDDHLRLQLIRALDDRTQLTLVDEGCTRVNIRQDRNAKAVELSRPSVDVDRFMPNDQPVRFNKEPPKHKTRQQQQDHARTDAQSLLPARIVSRP